MSQEEKVIAETGSLHLIMENVATYFSDNLYDAGGFMDKLLRADPDLICYCAVKAIKDE